MPMTSMKKSPVKAQSMTQISSPQSNASVRYPVGGILIGSLHFLSAVDYGTQPRGYSGLRKGPFRKPRWSASQHFR